MVISPVVLLMMKSPWAPTRISYVISPFDPSSASTAVSWNWKSQHKSSGHSTFHHHVIPLPAPATNKRSLLSNTHTVSKESSLVIYTLVFLNLGYCVMKQSHQKRFFCCCSCESDKRLWILKAIFILTCCCCCWVASVVPDSVRPHRRQPTRLPVPGILQARTLEWVAISFSNAWKWRVKVKMLSHVRLLATPWTAAYQSPPSLGCSRQEYWSGVPLPSPKAMTLQKYKES